MIVLRVGEPGAMSMMTTLLSAAPTKSLFTFFASATPFGAAPVLIVCTYCAAGVLTSKMSTPPVVRSATYKRCAPWSTSMMSNDPVFPWAGGIFTSGRGSNTSAATTGRTVMDNTMVAARAGRARRGQPPHRCMKR
jgi:hypothetical protein